VPTGDFTEQAVAYRSRPGYPAELVDQLVVEAGVQPGDPVVDLGAGTGLFTRELVARGFTVTAVEPNETMRSQSTVRPVHWVDGTFEETQLAEGSQQWAVAAQAFHWADPKRALPEIRRILQPGRLFTAIWNVKAMDAEPNLQWTIDAIRRRVPDFHEYYDGMDWRSVFESTDDFSFVGARFVRHVVEMSRERFLDLWRSHHWLQQLAARDAFAALMDEMATHFARASIERFEVPYDCSAWSARRRD
jgi:SAM-dependent methyltransferase